MTHNDHLRLMNQWTQAGHGPTDSMRCCFSDETPNHLQLWFTFGLVDADGLDRLEALMEANDEIDAQADGMGYFACLTEADGDRFAWVVRMPFTPATSADDLQRAVTLGSAHAVARWNAAVAA